MITTTADGETPLDPDEAADLIPGHISNRKELNEWEQANILAGVQWALGRETGDLLSITFVKRLHHEMFSRTWRWAGKFRKTDKNIGVPWPQVSISLKHLFEDATYWIEHRTYDADEIAARFHHRLVQIHPFPNGNGRHAREMTQLLQRRLGVDPFTWGRHELLQNAGTVRDRYIQALKAADAENIRPLLEFLRPDPNAG